MLHTYDDETRDAVRKKLGSTLVGTLNLNQCPTGGGEEKLIIP